MIVIDIDLAPMGLFTQRKTLGRLTIIQQRMSFTGRVGYYRWVYTVDSSPDFPGGYVFAGEVNRHNRDQDVMALVSKVTRQIGIQMKAYKEAINGS